ncbi:MAG: FAD-binding oxidoreductase [Candidatus Kapabacteria bacterium]|jgi:CDP-4-dehydro-6-deoxyglucose reductase|nr:FAD-binding oxidoreductase [Candidatus Kapabacteria bacterium]
MSKLDWYEGRVVDIIKETPFIRRFFIQIADLENYEFKAGQHIKIEFPIDARKNYRQYSLANAPDGSNIFELLIVLDPNGIATNYLFNEVEIGSILKVSEPRGNFLVPEYVDTDLCFISTGVGLAPLRSIYLDIMKRNMPHKHIYVIFGTRFMRDMIYIEEIEQLSQRRDFTFIPVLSRETSDDWKGRRGYLHEVYKELFDHVPPVEYYICGWRDMVSEARTNLMAMGYQRKQIHFERYD